MGVASGGREMHSIHFYDETSNLLFLSDGNEIKLKFNPLSFASNFDAQRALENWAKKSGLIKTEDEIAMLV